MSAEIALDRECIVRIRSGETERFGTLLERDAPRIYTHLFRLVRNREEAEDLTQETFSRAYQFLARLDAERPFRNWLYTIATNVGLNALRAQRRRGSRIGFADDADDAAVRRASGAICEPVAPGEDPLQRAARNDLARGIVAAVRRLPPRSAMLVHLHYYEGLPVREAAEIAGMTESAAKVALHRARRKLREWLVDGGDHRGNSCREEE